MQFRMTRSIDEALDELTHYGDIGRLDGGEPCESLASGP